MGVHTGEAEVEDEGYVGLDVVRGARICSAGHGGQILLSDTTRALLGGAPPDGAAIQDLGERRLKDLEQPERIYQLTFAGGPISFPALKADDSDELAAMIKAGVRRQIQESFAAAATEASKPPARDTFVGLAELVGLAIVVIVIVVIVKLVF